MKLIYQFLSIFLIFSLGSLNGQTSFNISNQTTGDTLFTIDNDGNTGIGLTNPFARLDVQMFGNGPWQRAFRVLNPDMVADDALFLVLGRSDDFRNMGHMNFKYVADQSVANRLSFGLYGVNDVLNIMGSGKVGIGTTDPLTKLQLNGTFGISDTVGLPNQTNYNLYMAGNYNNGVDIGKIYVGDNTGWRFHFATRTGGVDSDLVTIADNGNVGIGSNAPNERLEVTGTIHSTSGGFRFPDGTVQATAAGGSLWNQNASDIYFNSGNVGIGTSNPTYPLSIYATTSSRGLNILHNQTGTISTYGLNVDLTRSGTGNADAYGIRSTATNDNGVWTTRGVSASASGNSSGPKYGVFGIAQGEGGLYGVKGVASATGSNSQYGVWGEAIGSGTGGHYGVYGIASGGGTNHWAGYFNGRVYVDENLGIGTSTPSEMLEVADTIYSSVGGFKFPDGTVQETAAGGGLSANTLDQAYDQGGAGVGRTITADAGAFQVNGTDGVLFTGTPGSGSIPATGAGGRMMWYPNSSAFRAGYVTGTQWDDANIGGYSAAMGYNAQADGSNAIAMGPNTISSGLASIAIGNNSQATANYSTAFGSETVASGNYSMAMGREIEAAGDYSMAIALSDQNGLQVTQNNTMAIMGGNVGIGTSTPAYPLSVAGTIHSTSGGFRFPDGTTQTTSATGGAINNTLDQAYDQGGAGAGRTIVADAGEVHISGPDGLTVDGNLIIGAGSGTNNDYLFFDNSDEGLFWNETEDRFEFSDAVSMLGPIQTGTSASYVSYNKMGSGTSSSGDMTGSGDLFISTDLEVGQQIYAQEDIVLQGELLGTNVISSPNILDEPGVASDTEWEYVAVLNGGIDVILSRSINVPAAGYVLVIGTCEFSMYHTSTSEANFGVSNVSTSFADNQEVGLTLDSGTPSGTYDFPVTVHGLFEVTSSGSHTFYFLGENESDGPSRLMAALYMQLTLVYFPTAYGTVIPTESSNTPKISKEDMPRRYGLTSQEINQEKTVSKMFNKMQIQNELDELQRKIDELRNKVEENNSEATDHKLKKINK